MMRFLIILLPIYIYANVSGLIINAQTQNPIANAKIIAHNIFCFSDKNGRYTIDTNASTLHVKAYGYRPFTLHSDINTTALLKPIKVKSLYLSFWGANPKTKTFKRILNIVDKTEVNSIIVDVKNEFGLTSYKTSLASINAKGAYYQRTIKDINAFIKIMKKHDVYLIARVVVFKDDLQATHWPERALKKPDGSVWRNREKLAWIDPFNDKSHTNALEVARNAAILGFDEVNFDYIRFPAYQGLKHSQKSTQKTRTKAIETFLAKAQKILDAEGVFSSVDTYGQICWAQDDTGIGQTVSSLAKYADYLSPMLYPSGFPKGAMGFKDPTAHNYDIIYQSIKQIHDRVKPIRVRPWLQSFKDYAHSRKFYKKKEIRDQINASRDAQTNGWLIWNPSSRYYFNAFVENERTLEEVDVVQTAPQEAVKLAPKKPKACKPLLKKSPYGEYYFDHCQLGNRGLFQ